MRKEIIAGLLALAVLSSPATTQVILYVSASAASRGDGTSWNTAFRDLQDALHVAEDGYQVWVATGTYKPDGGTLDKTLSFVVTPGVEVYGGFVGDETQLLARNPALYPTILTADLAGNDPPSSPKYKDNSHHVILCDGPSKKPSVMDGFIVVGGNATSGEILGGGAALVTDGNVVFRNTIFESNRGEQVGAVQASSATLLFDNCTFRKNFATIGQGGAIGASYGSGIQCEGCAFVSNSAFVGGALAQVDGEVSLIRCKLIDNNTSASGAGGSFSNTIVNIDSCVIIGNHSSAYAGGGLAIFDSAVVIAGSTFAYNNASGSAAGAGGAFIISTSGKGSAVISDCILWKNKGPAALDVESNQLVLAGLESMEVRNSCIEGLDLWAGDGNIDAEPTFASVPGADGKFGTEDDDLSLQETSPCVDAGSPEFDIATTDVNGFPRLQDGNLDGTLVTDMGAYEFHNVELSVSGGKAVGDAIKIAITGTTGLTSFLIVGSAGGDKILEPYGVLLVDWSEPWLRLATGALPVLISGTVPASAMGVVNTTLQALAVASGRPVGNLSNAVAVTVAD